MSDGPDAMPADPFAPMDAGGVAVIAMFRALRRGGGSLIEAALIVGANMAVNGLIAQAKEEPPAPGDN